MKQSEIRLIIELDENNFPDKIFWNATDSPTGQTEEAKAVSLSMWDPKNLDTMRIDLWAKDMMLEDMKRFMIDAIGGMAQTLREATGDEYMAAEMEALCQKMQHRLNEQLKTNYQQ